MKQKLIVFFIILLILAGCSSSSHTELLIDNYNRLDKTMINALEEETPFIYQGKYFTVKLKQAFKYINQSYPDRPMYVYSLLIIPKYNMKTKVTGIKLESAQYSKQLKRLYSEINDSYGRLDSATHTFNSIEEFRGWLFEYIICDNNSNPLGNQISEEEYYSALNDFNITITINGKKDIINIKDFTISDYDKEINKSNAIDNFERNGHFSISLLDYDASLTYVKGIKED